MHHPATRAELAAETGHLRFIPGSHGQSLL